MTSESWVFGYGSLCWNPGFPYAKSIVGFVRGFTRKFWQGNVTHRGTKSKPGRVATLIQDPNGVVWGRAFLLESESIEALSYLDEREVELGGYERVKARFTPGDPSASASLPVTLYTATPSNPHWLGQAPDWEIASQILVSSGPSGNNVEYLLRLAQFMREEAPEAEDEHLFRLEALVRSGVDEANYLAKIQEETDFAGRVRTNNLRYVTI